MRSIKNSAEMPANIKLWIHAFRLHTLPLAASGILLGNIIALGYHDFHWSIFLLSLLTAILLQILSNLANDYGDTKHGVDNPDRVGPERIMQSGIVSVTAMKRMLGIFIALCLISGILLLVVSLQIIGWTAFGMMLVTGLAAIWAAFNYTASENPYGYRGWGDLFVFIFFGIVCVFGAFYLQTGMFRLSVLLAAAGIGFYSAAVLNINNLRDIETDIKTGKNSIPVLLGKKGGRIYHLLLILLGSFSFLLFGWSFFVHPLQFVFLTPILAVLFNSLEIFQDISPDQMTNNLKKMSIFTLILVISFGLSLLILKCPNL
jgi:1,4-dihydroxy-2-naphthoate octaprenyltransferase